MEYIFRFFITAFVIFILYLFILFKNKNTQKNRMIVFDAILRYNDNTPSMLGDVSPYVGLLHMEEEWKTFWRLYDWGYKNILPKDKYNIVKPYIEDPNKNNPFVNESNTTFYEETDKSIWRKTI